MIDDSPFFAGVHGLDYGSTTSKHPSYHQEEGQAPASELRWFLDMMPFDGGNLVSPNITPDTQTGIGGWSDAENPTFKAAEGERQPAMVATRDVPPRSPEKRA